MADIEKILDGLNIPKQILEKSEQLLKTLFGQSFDEIGGMIADQVKLRRFKNQIKIFGKAQEILKENKIDPKKVSLKVLAPLIELSSYEEEETLQDKWANLIAYVLKGNADTVFQQNSITILNKLSNVEAVFLDGLYEEVQKKRVAQFNTLLERYEKTQRDYPDYKFNTYPKQPHEFHTSEFTYIIHKYVKERKLERSEFHLMISNLVTLGVLQWETDVSVGAEKRYEDPNDNKISTEVYVSSNYKFAFTSMGEKFVKLSKGL
jgi:uncharacterized protein YbcV (DUF1398 family)